MDKTALENVKLEAKKQIDLAKELKDLDMVFKRYLGKNGEIAGVFSSLDNISAEQRMEIGKIANETKKYLEAEIERKKSAIIRLTQEGPVKKLDITAPGKRIELGHLHPLTIVKRKIEEIFKDMGFSIAEGPEIETEFYNFDALNIPKDHPARDMWDTFYLNNGLLLRTHTSPGQIRYMEKNSPPLKVIVPGRCFRHEATDASHETNFYQVEGLMLGKEISVANFKAIIQEFFSRFFGKDIDIRLRPGFFPFVEPGFEVDISCTVCGGAGCSTCSQSGWLEIMGAGMVHPNVLKAGGIMPEDGIKGFAFGCGMDRLAMMKYKIGDIRLLYNGDMRFLKQF